MAKSASEGLINHYSPIRLRVTGSCALKMRLLSLNEVRSYTLQNLAVTATSAVELTKKSNFEVQRVQLEIKTTEIDETFLISKIIIFAKAVGEDYPQ